MQLRSGPSARGARQDSGTLSEPEGEAVGLRQQAVVDTPEFKRWFGASKLVDPEGQPMVLFHGTGWDFSVLVPSAGGAFGPGIYLADTPEEAERWGGLRNTQLEGEGNRLIPVYVRMENPYYWHEDDAHRHPNLVSERVRKAGHDGVVRLWGDGSMEVVVFTSPQVKSALGNCGAFDPANPDIRG